MDVTYYVALPFVRADDGLAPGEAVECPSGSTAIMRAEALSRKPGCAGEFPRELFRKHGIAYELAKQTKSELFRDLLPLLNSGRIVLPCNDCLQGQIVGLERRTSAVGRDTISHPDRGHDDVVNAVAGAAGALQIRRIRHQHELGVGRRRLECEDPRLDS